LDQCSLDDIIHTLEYGAASGRPYRRVLVTGRGLGGAVAALFLLRHAPTMTQALRANTEGEDTSRESVDGDDAPEGIEGGQTQFHAEPDIRCVTLSCPRFMDSTDIERIPADLLDRILHIYGEHERNPMYCTSLEPLFGRPACTWPGTVLIIKDS
jgi:hypothetical protein